jgi:putative exporter of polyketide antibiotics
MFNSLSCLIWAYGVKDETIVSYLWLIGIVSISGLGLIGLLKKRAS